MLLVSGVTLDPAKANAAISASNTSPTAAAATRIGCDLRSCRDNVDMPGVSQALVEFANHHRQPAAPGIEVIERPRYRIMLQPVFPIPGPNSIAWVRCSADEADEVIREARGIVAPRHLAVNWILDPETQPADFADHLARHGVELEAEAAVMVLPIDAPIDKPDVEGLRMH